MRPSSALIALCALAACAAGDSLRSNAMGAMAPGPAAAELPKADLLVIIAANTANFTSPTRLTLGGVSATAQYTGNGGKAGVYPIDIFTNSSDGAPFVSSNGDWLGSPQAVLYGTPKTGNMTSVLLNLSLPKFDAETKSVTFDVEVVTPTKASQKYKGGAVGAAIKDASNNLGPVVSSSVDATTELRSAALFIDSNRLALGKAGDTKFFLGWLGGWGGGWGYNRGWGYNNGGWGGGGCGWGGCGWGK